MSESLSTPLASPHAPTRGLGLDERSAQARESGRSSRKGGLSRRERLAVALIGGAFIVACLALLETLERARSIDAGTALVVVMAYAVVSRMEFELGTGSVVPTQLVLVPMLFTFPLALVPILVLAGQLAGSSFDVVAGRIHPARLLLRLVDSWFVIGPVAVLAFAPREVGLSAAPWYMGALAAQFACEFASVAALGWIATGRRPGRQLPYMARAWAIDAALASVGLAAAYAGQREPLAVLLVVPLAVLLDVLSRERRAHIDSVLELSTAYRGTAYLLGDIVEADDAYTGFHSRDVIELCLAVADELGVDELTRRDVELTALLHDVGKIRIPSEVINKRGPLDDDEWALMRMHTIEGERMLARVGGLLGRVGGLVRACHERWDGGGYPDGRAGAEIPVVARIVMCCDAFSAMTTTRSYREAMPFERALDEIRANAGAQFDPDVAAALVAVVERGAHRRIVERAVG